MDTSFIKIEFWALIVCSLIVPGYLYRLLMAKNAISRGSIALFGMFLLLLAGVDVTLLKALKVLATHSASLMDDALFNSEYSLALYLLPFASGGVGCNLISHVLISHLQLAEQSYDKLHAARQSSKRIYTRLAANENLPPEIVDNRVDKS